MTVLGLEDVQKFKVEIKDNIATVTIANPPVNAQDRQMREEVVRVFDVLGLSPDVRVIILTGEGRIFSAGAALNERSSIESEPDGFARHNRLTRTSFDVIMECPKPVIAAVNGAAVGGGCVMALVCDIVLVSETAFMSMTEVDFGLAGGARHLLRSFSSSDARMMIYTARRISGPELVRMNAASACLPPNRLQDEARVLAREIARKVPLAIEAAKRSFIVTEEMSLRDGYRFEQTQTAALAKTQDTKEALLAFKEKRKAVYKGC